MMGKPWQTGGGAVMVVVVVGTNKDWGPQNKVPVFVCTLLLFLWLFFLFTSSSSSCASSYLIRLRARFGEPAK